MNDSKRVLHSSTSGHSIVGVYAQLADHHSIYKPFNELIVTIALMGHQSVIQPASQPVS